ncbi:MAG TPA: chromosome partitioning protein ParA, partial [Alphaproteobacteria bacterium]|nr:chromosome partitioning protein ParA [Alphaproteobacteria bacterium]
QIIVSRDGWAWRWDGYTVTPQAKTATAVRLQQRNRLTAIQQEIAQAESEAQLATNILNEASAVFALRQSEDKQAREALQAAFAALNDARNTYAQQEKESTAITSKLAALDDSLKQLHDDMDQVSARTTTLEDERRALPDIEAQRADMGEKRARLAEQRSLQSQRQSECDRLTREDNICVTRIETVTQDVAAWQSRLGNATQQINELAERIAGIEVQLEQLRGRPAELESAHSQLLTELSAAEEKRKEASDRLIETEQRLSVIEHQLKSDENALGSAKEERVRAEGNVQASGEQFNTLRERMSEKLNCSQEELLGIAAFTEGEEIAPAHEYEQTLARYVRERENMGPVNLRAEVESETMQGEIDKLQKEKDDLVAAIAKLRQGIAQLNKEARERLQNAFGSVNERFQKLFGRLFGGGKAHLELIDDEDPLNAGLEIFASPPGKKMQILSLLSGGERTLTALALLFAVFQTNPSPICVLDEAEAALDESNIGRFCDLVEDIARETGTRFLIITHQRLTMAKMDRLYGVTMSEKGVSQLVSVDLAGAVAIRDGEQHTSKAEEALEAVQAA